jgi:hypothetical protein
MSLETEVRARLAADGTISGLVSTRIFPLMLPQNPTYPALVFRRISGPRMHDLQGSIGRGTARLQIDSWATGYLGAQALAAAVRSSLDGFTGMLTSLHAVIKLDNEIDDYDDDADKYRVIQDFRIIHTE